MVKNRVCKIEDRAKEIPEEEKTQKIRNRLNNREKDICSVSH